jgi:SAM-dependent methyltransferase
LPRRHADIAVGTDHQHRMGMQGDEPDLGGLETAWPIRRVASRVPAAVTNRVVFNPFVWKFLAKYWYPLLTRFARRLDANDVLFLNHGYEEDPPMAVPLEASDEANRFFLQLYHRTATQVDLTGKQVLEVSCGHGGGASYLVRTLRPASYTGLDLNPAGIDFCRKRHNLPGLDFVHGNAENLPFDDQSFDAVINIEASHCYPRFPRFLAEVARVLRPGGHFLYVDVRRRERLPEWEAALADAPVRMVSRQDINEQALRGMEKRSQRSQDLISRHVPAFLRGLVRDGTGVSGAALDRALQSGDFSHRIYCFAKD